MRWFLSDVHINHRNVIVYCNRPWASVEEMNPALVQMVVAQAKPGDTIYCTGDVSLNPKWSGWFLAQVNAQVPNLTWILVPGNHDACFDFPGKSAGKKAKMRNKYLADGWAEIHQTMQLTLKDGTNVLLSHLPYAKGAEQYDLRYLEMRPKDEGMILVHGHLHGNYKKNGRMIDVGIDGHDWKMVSEDELIALIKDEREFIPSPLTEWYIERRKTEPPRTNMQGLPETV